MEEDKKQQEVRVGQWYRSTRTGKVYTVVEIAAARANWRYFGDTQLHVCLVNNLAQGECLYDPIARIKPFPGVPVGSYWKLTREMDSYSLQARAKDEVVVVAGYCGDHVAVLSADGRRTWHGNRFKEFCAPFTFDEQTEPSAPALKPACVMPNCKAPPPYSSPTRLHGTLCWAHYQEREKQLAAAVHQEDLIKLAGRLNAAAAKPEQVPVQSHCLRAGTGVWSLRAR